MRLVIRVLLFAAAVFLVAFGVASQGGFGNHEGPGEIRSERRPQALVDRQVDAIHSAAREIGVSRPKQVLFGDLHVHTTVSFDAFLTSMPMLNGEGSRPQADACDFARYCSALDFWSINDHAATITQRNWDETVESIRECNETAGDPANPDTVAYLGWEWTHVGTTPDNHWGHKNVVLRGLGDDEIPTRPIAATTVARLNIESAPGALAAGALSLFGGDDRYDDMARFFAERSELDLCPSGEGISVRDHADECIEAAGDPGELFAKLDDWGVDSIVIPHGTTWGMYTPSGSDWKKQVTPEFHDPNRQKLIEVYSGHGNSDEYRDWRAIDIAEDGSVSCPAPRDNYLPRCWQAGELIRERCLDDGESKADCEQRAVTTRQLAAEAGLQAHFVLPGYDPEEWLDAGQCRDCAEPSFNYRPAGSAQYIHALSNFDEDGEPLRARMGFMSSSDNHKARPGTGYKEVKREAYSESRARDEITGVLASIFRAPEVERESEPVAFDRESTQLLGFQLFEMERQASFFMTGGLMGVHSEGRDRGAIWDSMQRREVYGTSGPRMLLWFDLLNAPGSLGRSLPMGGEAELDWPPIFQARAVGSFEQLPGCPESSIVGLGDEAIDRVCAGECYHPSDQRRLITRIEVVRILPQRERGEPVADLIEDPWRVFECEPDPAGCSVVFSDPDYPRIGRDALYYVRAHEAVTPTVNAGGVRCTPDGKGGCLSVDICGLDGNHGDDCLSPAEPKAWSSPIFIDWPAQSMATASAAD